MWERHKINQNIQFKDPNTITNSIFRFLFQGGGGKTNLENYKITDDFILH